MTYNFAIYLSGRGVEEVGAPNKGTMALSINNDKLRPALSTITLLTDALVISTTKRQSEVLYYKLQGLNEQDIADALGIKQSGVNQHSSTAKWYCMEEALNYFENINFEEYE